MRRMPARRLALLALLLLLGLCVSYPAVGRLFPPDNELHVPPPGQEESKEAGASKEASGSLPTAHVAHRSRMTPNYVSGPLI